MSRKTSAALPEIPEGKFVQVLPLLVEYCQVPPTAVTSVTAMPRGALKLSGSSTCEPSRAAIFTPVGLWLSEAIAVKLAANGVSTGASFTGSIVGNRETVVWSVPSSAVMSISPEPQMSGSGV